MDYIALGDSITAYRENVKVYFEWLQEHQAQLQMRSMVNRGVGGWTSEDVLESLKKQAPQAGPVIVTLMIGTNDHAIYKGRSESAVSPEQYEKNLLQIVDWVRDDAESGSAPGKSRNRIILMTPPYVCSYTNHVGTDTHQERLLAYCEKVKKVSVARQTGLVDINTITGEAVGWDDGTYYGEYTEDRDGVHLNSRGQRLIYPYILQQIEEAAHR